MTFVVLCPFVHRPSFEKMIATLDPALAEQAIVIDNTRENLGAAGSRNVGARILLDAGADWLVDISPVTRFGPSAGRDFIAALDEHPDAWVVQSAAPVNWHLIAWHRRLFETVGEFDENFWPIYCLAPETPVLTADLRWVALDDLDVGSRIVGVQESAVGVGASRKYEAAEVTSKSRRFAECVRLTFEDGREVVCTPEHGWLTKLPLPSTAPYKWRITRQLQVGSRIMCPLDVWPTASSYESGWLAGIYDGEGHLHISDRLRGVTFCQKEGAVLDRAKGILASMGIPFTWRYKDETGVVTIEVNRRRHAMRLLGELRPVRLLQERAWNGTHVRSRIDRHELAIESIEPIGVREVVTIETTSRTFIANGLVSHNCEDGDMARRIHLAQGEGAAGSWVNVDVDAWVTMYGHSQKLAGLVVDQTRLWDHYAQKWGGPWGDEAWTRPFDGDDLAFWPVPPDPRSIIGGIPGHGLSTGGRT